MSELLPETIQSIGETHVKEALLQDNFANIKTAAVDNTFSHITADGVTINLLIRTKTVMHPETYEEFSDQEKAKIISNSIIDNRIAYAAYVTIDSNGILLGEINWHKLT